VAERVGLINDLCGEREVKMAFNLSKEPIVDEVTTDAIMKIKYFEFLEAFARIADKSSLPRFTRDDKWNPKINCDEKGKEKRR